MQQHVHDLPVVLVPQMFAALSRRFAHQLRVVVIHFPSQQRLARAHNLLAPAHHSRDVISGLVPDIHVRFSSLTIINLAKIHLFNFCTKALVHLI